MNITTTIPDESVVAWQYRVDQFNAGSGLPPVTVEQFIQLTTDEETARLVAEKAASDRAALVPVADALLAADSDTRAEVLSFAKSKLGLE